MEPKVDVYIICSYQDWNTTEKNIPYIRKNLPVQNVYVVFSKKLSQENLFGCTLIDEDIVLPCMTFDSVKASLESYGIDGKNAGWYFQQFLKLTISFSCKNEYYLTWDADTILLNPIHLFDDAGKFFFTMKREYISFYFYTIKNLLGYKKRTKDSFISEHMLFMTSIVQNMLAAIGKKLPQENTPFWEKIIAGIELKKNNPNNIQRNFSEFETYGTYTDYTPAHYNICIQSEDYEHCVVVSNSWEGIQVLKFLTGQAGTLTPSLLKNGANKCLRLLK